MTKKLWSIVIILLNLLGILCLIYYAIPYLVHDVTTTSPGAMLPMQRWEASGIVLTVGLLPLIIVNVFAMVFVGRQKIKMPLRALFLMPCVVCFGFVIHYWILSV